TKSNLIETFRQVDEDTLLRKVDVGADLGGERHIEAPAVALDVEQHAARSLLGADDLSALAAVRIDQRQSDEIVQEVLVFFELPRLVLFDLDGPVAHGRDLLGAA